MLWQCLAIETGKYDPSLPLAFKLAGLFDLSIEEVFDPGDQRLGEGFLWFYMEY